MLVRNDSLVPMLATNRGLDRMLGDLFRDFSSEGLSADGTRYPAVDAWEDESSFHVEAELPGMKESDLEISVIDNELRIAAETEAEKEESTVRYHRRERRTGRFHRVIRFPVDIDADQVSAKFESGVLRIALPKAAKALPRKIAVKS